MNQRRPYTPDPQTEMERYHSLSAREREVFERILRGDTQRDISCDLALSQKTIFTYLDSTKRKLHCHNLVQLVLFAVRNRLIKP